MKSLYTKLKEYREEGRIPFHMPGHKGSDRYSYLTGLGAAMDITEIDGFDNLHDPSGVLLEGMELLSRVYGSRRSFYLINGSTGGLLAAVRCAVPFGGTVIMARNCHKAVYNAVELVGAKPVYIDPPSDGHFGFCLDLDPCAAASLLDAHPHASALIVTSPTYDGVVSDISALSEVCHRRGIPLIVDEAHGAHLGFLDEKAESAVRCGADIVIQSFHKTLPSLTQTAVAHIGGTLIDADRFAAELAVFETSSPSYLLMASLDGCTRLLADEGERDSLFRRWRQVIEYAEERLCGLTGVHVFQRNTSPSRAIHGYDRSKLAISVDGMDGPGLAALLRRHSIEPEMVAAGYVLLMTGADTKAADVDALAAALEAAGAMGRSHVSVHGIPKLSSGERVMRMTPFEARRCEKERVCLDSLGGDAVSGDYVFAYPPGIPIVVPGEVLTEEVKAALREILRLKLNPSTLHGAFEGEISVVRDSFVEKIY